MRQYGLILPSYVNQIACLYTSSHDPYSLTGEVRAANPDAYVHVYHCNKRLVTSSGNHVTTMPFESSEQWQPEALLKIRCSKTPLEHYVLLVIKNNF